MYYDYDVPIHGKAEVKDTDYGHYGIYHVYSNGRWNDANYIRLP